MWHYAELGDDLAAAPSPAAGSKRRAEGGGAAAASKRGRGGQGEGVSSVGPPSAARSSGALDLALDPVAEHRAWSPWVQVVAGDTVPAWMRCAALLLPASHQQSAPVGRAAAAALAML